MLKEVVKSLLMLTMFFGMLWNNYIESPNTQMLSVILFSFDALILIVTYLEQKFINTVQQLLNKLWLPQSHMTSQ